MMTTLIDTLLLIMATYLAIGFVFGVFFVMRGVQQLDEGAMNAPWHFRLIIFPGSVLLWIVLLFKLIRR